MYQAALASAKEKLLMEIEPGEETRRTLLKERRARQEAMDHFTASR